MSERSDGAGDTSWLPSPLGPEVKERSAFRIWLAVLVVSVAGVGFVQLRVDSIQALNRERYVVALLLAAVIAVAMSLFIRFVVSTSRVASVAGAAVFMLIFFRWNLFLGLANNYGLEIWVRDLLVAALAIAGAAILLSRPMRTVVLVSAICISTAALLWGVIPYVRWATVEPRTVAAVDVASDNVARDDVLIVLLDAYLREDWLETMAGFDNSGVRLELESLGFVTDPNEMSNYNATYGSFASMMALEPPLAPGQAELEDLALVRQLLGGDGPLFQAFGSAGYEITSHVNGWRGSRCGAAITHCERRGLFASTAWYLFETTPLAPVLLATVPHPFTMVSLDQLQNLASVTSAAFEGEAPQLVWAHIALPHPPVHLDAECEIHMDGWRRGSVLTNGKAQHDRRVVAYTEQIQCVNRLLVDQLDAILDKYPETRVLIVSDHGPTVQLVGEPDEWSREDIVPKMAVMTALRAPAECDDVLDAVTQVNTFRRFTNCTLDTRLVDVDDRQFIIPIFGNPTEISEVFLEGP